jgi:hypothetical protein
MRNDALGFIQPLTEMSTRSRKIMFLGSRARPARREWLATLCRARSLIVLIYMVHNPLTDLLCGLLVRIPVPEVWVRFPALPDFLRVVGL